MQDRNPAIGREAFVCPHCKAFAQQRWHKVFAAAERKPPVPTGIEQLREMLREQKEREARGMEDDTSSARLEGLIKILEFQQPGVDESYEYLNVARLLNTLVTTCFACGEHAIWIGRRIAYPAVDLAVPDPNPDMPPEIQADYREAGAVLLVSPRAAAALLRLSIQKLCGHILKRQGNIDEMIGELVSKGLDVRVQQALDIVRVIGNEAIHPGTVDLRDDYETATRLFSLVNLITDAMISQPRHIEELYSRLPENKVKGIERRNAKALTQKSETAEPN